MEQERRRKEYPASLIMDFQQRGDKWEGTAAPTYIDQNGGYFWGTPWYASEPAGEQRSFSWFDFAMTTRENDGTASNGMDSHGFFFGRIRTLMAPEIEYGEQQVAFDYADNYRASEYDYAGQDFEYGQTQEWGGYDTGASLDTGHDD